MRRRAFIAGSAAGAALLAGCSGLSNVPGSDDGSSGGTNSTGTYSVEMAPVGTVEFDSVPTSVAHYFPGNADMAVALVHGGSVESIGVRSRHHTDHYAELDGVSVDEETAVTAGEIAAVLCPQGPYLDGMDGLIAAVGRELGAPVVSRDGDLTPAETKKVVDVEEY